MNVIILLHSGVGGSGVVATELGLSLAAGGHRVHFIANAVPFRLGDATPANVDFHQIGGLAYPLFDTPLRTLSEASRIVEVVETHDIDVIHAHYAIPHATAALLARQMLRRGKRPGVVTTLHGTDVTLVGLDRAYLRATQWSIESSDVVTAVSSSLAGTTTGELGVRRDDIRVIPNAVDHARYAEARATLVRQQGVGARERYAAPFEKILMHVSNFRAVKRTDDVVRIFAKVAAQLPARLVMVGEGPERPQAMALATELGVADRIGFVGSFPRVEMLLAVADLFVLPSAQESFGLAALEAMASGMPVVASAIGGIPEVVEDGVTGALHPMGDVDAMAASALRLLADPELHARTSQAASDRARLSFNEREITAAYLSAYQHAIERA